MKIKKIIYAILGTLCLILAIIGAILPVLPTVPFVLLAAFCFARSSDRLNKRFMQSKLYKKYVQAYKDKKGMPLASKIKVMLIVTALFSFAFWKMEAVPIGRIIIVAVWLGHVYYFFFKIKTLQ